MGFERISRPYERIAFTLVELLVVIAIIGVLASLLLPVLAGIKSRAGAAICLNNKRQLGLAWRMYCEDNQGVLPSNDDWAIWSGRVAWAYGWLDWGPSPANTNVANLLDRSLSALAPYLQNAEVYKCPADTFLSPTQRVMGWTRRVRSVAMNQYMGPQMTLNSSDYDASGGVSVSGFVQYIKYQEMRKLSPSDAWVFIDEDPDMLGPLEFLLNPNPQVSSWEGVFPASYHSGGAGLGFADGHGELHYWVVPVTKQPVRYIPGPFDLASDLHDLRDVRWLAVRSTERDR
jgi:prepilin-type N-terminal cleavage/methylation domain-containing protein/prepilin-type processing-associated H-X9-DG protein